jgi:methionyl-tRNA formyltransferase
MKLSDIAMIIADTTRTKAYIQALTDHDLLPNFILIMHDPGAGSLPGQRDKEHKLAKDLHPDPGGQFYFSFDESISLEESLNNKQIPFSYVDSTDINSETVIKAISERPEKVFIYSGFGGAILRHAVLNIGKKFLHIHGGYLPDYKGSTTNYYNMIDDNECGASSIFMEEEIDEGPILLRRKFPSPVDRSESDYTYESIIRATVLIETIQRYTQNRRWEFEMANNAGGEIYFIIHPVLKHIAILADS